MLELIECPRADDVVAGGEQVGDVGMQALHPDPGAADATERARSDVVGGDRRVAFGGVAVVRRGDRVGVESRASARFDAAGGFEPADVAHQVGATR